MPINSINVTLASPGANGNAYVNVIRGDNVSRGVQRNCEHFTVRDYSKHTLFQALLQDFGVNETFDRYSVLIQDLESSFVCSSSIFCVVVTVFLQFICYL